MTSAATDLAQFVDDSPSPFHAVATVATRLDAAGYRRFDARESWEPSGRGGYVIRGGTIIAWRWPGDSTDGWRILGAHTDSPNLRVKQHPDRPDGTLALEPYGGPLLESWLDRDLKIAGRVVSPGGEVHLVDTIEPVVRVPRLAIHLSDESTTLDRQRHLHGVWTGKRFLTELAAAHGLERIDGFELMAAIHEPSRVVGDWLSAGRLDNLATCHAALEAFIATDRPASVLALFDHEEIGSTSERGAASDALLSTLERVHLAAGGSRAEFLQRLAGSMCVSGDMAHATHPNFVDRHEPGHRIDAAGGPVLKINQNLRYATDAMGAEFFARACGAAGVEMQRYVHRADLPCGSTIGPLSAARTGIHTLDVGAPQLAMHSARETMTVHAIETYGRALRACYEIE